MKKWAAEIVSLPTRKIVCRWDRATGMPYRSEEAHAGSLVPLLSQAQFCKRRVYKKNTLAAIR